MLGTHEFGLTRRKKEPQVGMTMRRLMIVGRYRNDDDVLQIGIRPRPQVEEPGLFGTFSDRHCEWVVLAFIGMSADLQPRPLPVVPSQQHSAARRMNDQRRGGRVQR